MTAHRVSRSLRQHNPLKHRDQLIAAEVRAEVARQKRPGLTQARMAAEIFEQDQQWLGNRLSGHVAFTPAELLAVADYLAVDVVPWLAAGKGDGPIAASSRTAASRRNNPCYYDSGVIIGPWTGSPDPTRAVA